MSQWKFLDEISKVSLQHINSADHCYFARDFVPGTGFQGGPTNDLVINFKKAPGSNGQSYRNRAVKQFATEASQLINCETQPNVYVCAIPSSKAKHDPSYDSRFEHMFAELNLLRPCIRIVSPIEIKQSTVASHHGGTRQPADIQKNYTWLGFTDPPPPFLWVFDDVLTSGAHFRAYSEFLIANGYHGQVYGIFWAKRS